MIRKFISYYRPHRKLFAADMACALLVAGCTMLYPIVTRQIINRHIPDGNLRAILVLAGVLLITYLLKAALNYFIQYWGHIMGVRIQLHIRRDAFDHLQRLPFTYFDQNKTGTIMSRIINDTFEISELAHHGPEDLFVSCVTILGAFVYLCTVELTLTLVVFACLPVLVFFAARMRKRLGRTAMQTRIEIGEVNADLENSVAGVRVARAYETSAHEAERFEAGNRAYVRARGLQYRAMAEFYSGTGLIMDVLLLVTITAGGIFAWRGRINAGDFAAYLLFVGLFTDPIKRLINFVEQLQLGASGFARVIELMDAEPEEDSPKANELIDPAGDIRFDGVTFHYETGRDSGETDVLRGLDLHIPAGQTVALVGPSGGGKSTLCHLIPRFYEIVDGAILLDGVDIRDYTRLSLRRQIGIVQQDAFLFTGTIRENIAYGSFDATEADIRRAAKLASIDEFVDSLPDGYDTYVGERGVMLSGGQKQRISIARIFLKDPRILILDEATSALDNTTEAQIQESLRSLSKGRTTLVVAHRLSTIQHADRIVVLTAQGIAESGTHDELMAASGVYEALWNAQKQLDR